MSELPTRRVSDQTLVEGLERRLFPERFDVAGQREWWKHFPKLPHYVLEAVDIFDFRSVDISGLLVGELNFTYCCFDRALARGSSFSKTEFQESTARGSDFSESTFIELQMSRFFAAGASFRKCRFEGGFLRGHHARGLMDGSGRPLVGGFNDFSDCDFREVVMNEVDLSYCDLARADFRGASVLGCNLRHSDLLGVDLSLGRFENCDLEMSRIDDTPQNRFAVLSGRHRNVGQLIWVAREF